MCDCELHIYSSRFAPCVLRMRRPPRSTRTDSLCPYSTLFRSYLGDDIDHMIAEAARARGAIEQGATREDLQTLLPPGGARNALDCARSEEHTSELRTLRRISYAVFCLKTKTPYPTKPVDIMYH